MHNTPEQDDKTVLSKIKRIIIILLILLILTASALVIRILYLNFFVRDNTTTIIPDNTINDSVAEDDLYGDGTNGGDVNNDINGDGSSDVSDGTSSNGSANADELENAKENATTISLFKGKPTDNERFEVRNMLPGDTEVKYFRVKVSHIDTVAVLFTAEVTEQTKALGNILHIKVTHLDTNKLIYDGTFNDMSIDGYAEIFRKVPANETTAYYKIEVSLPTRAGNEYQASMLKADFKWFVTDDVPLGPPQTGDNAPIFLWAVLAGSALIVLTALFIRHKKEEDKYAGRK